MVFIPELAIPDRFSPEEQDHIRKALEFASHAHAKQSRKDGKTPYIVHPAAVAQLLMDEFNADVETVIAGLLHDTVEDTDVRLPDIEGEFGPTIQFLVDGATDYGKNDGNPPIKDKMERNAYSKKKALQYAEKDERVLLVKIADRWNNMETVRAFTPRGQVGYSEDTLAFHVVHARRMGFNSQAERIEALAQDAIARWEAYRN